MGHTLPTITGHYDRFRAQLSDFRRVLRKSDQIAFDAMLDEVRQHLPAAGFAAHVLPEIMLLFCLSLEEHEKAKKHEAQIDALRADLQRELGKLRQELVMEIRKVDSMAFLETSGHKT
jgi:hypothetical protein